MKVIFLWLLNKRKLLNKNYREVVEIEALDKNVRCNIALSHTSLSLLQNYIPDWSLSFSLII